MFTVKIQDIPDGKWRELASGFMTRKEANLFILCHSEYIGFSPVSICFEAGSRLNKQSNDNS